MFALWYYLEEKEMAGYTYTFLKNTPASGNSDYVLKGNWGGGGCERLKGRPLLTVYLFILFECFHVKILTI